MYIDTPHNMQTSSTAGHTVEQPYTMNYLQCDIDQLVSDIIMGQVPCTLDMWSRIWCWLFLWSTCVIFLMFVFVFFRLGKMLSLCCTKTTRHTRVAWCRWWQKLWSQPPWTPTSRPQGWVPSPPSPLQGARGTEVSSLQPARSASFPLSPKILSMMSCLIWISSWITLPQKTISTLKMQGWRLSRNQVRPVSLCQTFIPLSLISQISSLMPTYTLFRPTNLSLLLTKSALRLTNVKNSSLLFPNRSSLSCPTPVLHTPPAWLLFPHHNTRWPSLGRYLPQPPQNTVRTITWRATPWISTITWLTPTPWCSTHSTSCPSYKGTCLRFIRWSPRHHLPSWLISFSLSSQ